MLVEDEYLLNKTIKTYLETKNYKVDSYADGLEALEEIVKGYDLFILDIDIPNISGIELLEQIRKLYQTTPIIIMSATIDMNMITSAYTKGCNDYLRKPFDIKELALKIEAFTRTVDKFVVLHESLLYNKDSNTLSYENREILLTFHEQLFLSLLLQNRGNIVNSEQLEYAIWGVDDAVPHLRQLISRLRKKLPLDVIQNRVGEGYFIV